MLRTITFNARSLRQPEVIELIIDYMRAHGIHCAALQETWLPGSLVEQNKGFTIVRHNADQKAGERGGVAIILDAGPPRRGTVPATPSGTSPTASSR